MISRLPKAPLTEVVFEMRWGLLNSSMPPLSTDPGYPIVLDGFSSFADKKGFNNSTDLHEPIYSGLGGSISKRFYKGENSFPLLQIGHGIYAANESVDYEWPTFKKMALGGAESVVQHYPRLRKFEFNIKHLEIRYLDTFEESLIGSSDFIKFIDEGTEANLTLPSFWTDNLLGSDKRGRLHIETDVRKLPGAKFSIDIASAKRDETPVIRMESKVISQGEKLISIRQMDHFSSKLDDWLEKSHMITSNSFKALISKSVFEQFK